MGPARLHIRARLRGLDPRSSAGFTLMEVLTAMALTVVIMAASGTMLYSAQKTSSADAENATAQAEAQAGLDRMVRDLRAGKSILTQLAGQITVQLLDGSQLSYKCDSPDLTPGNSAYQACYRLTAAGGAALPAASLSNLVIPRLSNPSTAPVFSYPSSTTVDDCPDPGDEDYDPTCVASTLPASYVAVHLQTPATGERKTGRKRSIILDSGFEMRNLRYDQSANTGS